MTRRVLITGSSGFIGSNAVAHFRAGGDEVLGLDRQPPRPGSGSGPGPAGSPQPAFQQVDLLDAGALAAAVAAFQPTHALHLGARTDLDGSTEQDYAVNTDGTANLLAALAPTTCERVVIASSMLVCRYGYQPRHDQDFCPTTVYGRSKQHMEELVRARPGGGPAWVLARLSSIWGPWFDQPYRPFFQAVRQRRFVHPGFAEIDKALGFVGNTVFQLQRLLATDRFDGQVVYLTDYQRYSIRAWADTIAAADGAPANRRVPVPLLAAAALVGDLLKATGVMAHPPLTSFRLRNMRQPSQFDTSALEAMT
ncbi:MAG: NAD-dependent epimerase/dehydratase family protein, partial [Acidimicrobiales bacterium]